MTWHQLGHEECWCYQLIFEGVYVNKHKTLIWSVPWFEKLLLPSLIRRHSERSTTLFGLSASISHCLCSTSHSSQSCFMVCTVPGQRSFSKKHVLCGIHITLHDIYYQEVLILFSKMMRWNQNQGTKLLWILNPNFHVRKTNLFFFLTFHWLPGSRHIVILGERPFSGYILLCASHRGNSNLLVSLFYLDF